MNFISLSFLGFGVVLFALWWALPARLRPWVLAAANVYFALNFGAQALTALVLITAAGWLCGLWMAHGGGKAALAVGVLAGVLPLAGYKYLPALAGRWQALAAFADLLMPVGISFFVFKNITYLVAVYKGSLAAEKNPLYCFAYTGFFAQLTSGPIQRAESLLPQLKSPPAFDRALALNGCVRLCWGIFLKKCLADHFAAYYNALYQPDHYYALSIVWSLAAYSLYIYFDFASYSQLSIGVANLLVLRCDENFLSPYLSRSVGEFWRRWHISLSSFLRDYIYIPLGGSRNGVPVLILATMVTFLVSGAWHGAALGFVVWGGLHGVYLLAGRATRGVREKAWGLLRQKPGSPVRSVVSWAVTLVLVCFAWIFFFSGDVSQVRLLMSYLIQPMPLSAQYLKESFTQLGYTTAVLVRLGLFALAAFGVDFAARKEGFGRWAAARKGWVQVIFCYACIFATLFWGAAGTLQNIYFQF